MRIYSPLFNVCAQCSPTRIESESNMKKFGISCVVFALSFFVFLAVTTEDPSDYSRVNRPGF